MPAHEQSGLVIGHFGLDIEVALDSGACRRVRVRRGAPPLVVGDRVKVSARTIRQGLVVKPLKRKYAYTGHRKQAAVLSAP